MATLIDELKSITIDRSQADEDLGNDTTKPHSLYQECKHILKFLQPLLRDKVFPCDVRSASLGEFDSETFVFRSTKVGKMMCHQGVSGFTLEIMVHGYNGTTFKLSVEETFWCSE